MKSMKHMKHNRQQVNQNAVSLDYSPFTLFLRALHVLHGENCGLELIFWRFRKERIDRKEK
jgi:hypothetical protein